MNRSLAIKLTVGALVLGASGFSLPASSHQGDGTWAGSNTMGSTPMMGGMMGSGPMGMMGGGMMGGGMMRGGPMGMMGGMMGHGPMRMMQMMRRYQEFDLSDEQERQIDDIQHKLHKRIWSLMGPTIDLHADLRKAYAGDRPDPAAVGAVYGKIFDLKRQMIEATVEAMNSANEVLTDEQREQMKQLGRNHMQGGRMMMHSGRGGMMQPGQGGMMQQGSGQSN